MKGLWKDSEVKALFCEVKSCLSCGGSLKEAFSRHAQKYRRAEGSVRNYYYRELARLECDKDRANKLDINLQGHKKNNIVYFSKEGEREFFDKIQSMTREGLSVRRACLTLANGDSRQMLRYQNKYRALCKKRENEEGELPNNVIRFCKKQPSITEGEIQALFAGIVRLVRRSCYEDVEQKLKEREEIANKKLRQMIALLGERERELERVKRDFCEVKKENEKLLQGARRNTCLKARVLKEKGVMEKNG